MSISFSVIIPTFNEEKYIKRVLLALNSQDYAKKFEIIVVDSNSKDKTVEIAEKFADKVIVIKERGIARGRNLGAKAARGDFFLFLDADTIPATNLISEFEKSFAKKNVVGVTCHLLPLEATLHNIWFYNFYNFQLELTLKLKKPHVAGACVAYRKTAFQKVGGFDESRATLEDIALSEKIAKLGKIIVNTNTAALHSTRRIKKWGVLRSLGKYSKLYLEYLLQGKNFDYREYPPVR